MPVGSRSSPLFRDPLGGSFWCRRVLLAPPCWFLFGIYGSNQRKRQLANGPAPMPVAQASLLETVVVRHASFTVSLDTKVKVAESTCWLRPGGALLLRLR